MDRRSLDDFITSRKASNTAKYYKAIRSLHKYRAVLTYGGHDSEPWPGASVEALSGNRSSRKKIKTRAIPLAVWWPRPRASWKYIDVFAGDMLKARSRWEELNEPGTPAGLARSHRDLLRDWLDEPSNVIPLPGSRHYADRCEPSAEGFHVRWRILSFLVSRGQTALMFSGSKRLDTTP
jgi:hypothetical protein